MLDYTIFGESHGPAVGVLVTGAAVLGNQLVKQGQQANQKE